MIEFTLLSQAEKLASSNPLKLEPAPLYHQMRTLEALHQYDLVMNTYNTGTGKTIASLLYLFKINDSGKNVLFIAPTNALLAQHAEDIQEFVIRNNLNFRVQQVTADRLRALGSDLRSGEILQRLIRNYLEFDPAETRRQPLILVINPDIFYYALFFRYGAHDRLNVFERFVTAFDYIVIDEFHYYDSKQLANFLFALALFDQLGYFSERGRKVCLLSATPTLAVQNYLDSLFPGRWRLVSPANEPSDSDSLQTSPSLTELRVTLLNSELQDWVIQNRSDLRQRIRQHQDGAIISNSLWRVNQAHQALRAVMPDEQLGRITGPEPPEKRSQATACNLILATPTVDIGYNFKKLGKARQNVDFIICDARYGDELLQRIGRAGRVLGKTETQEISWAVALLPQDAIDALGELNGATLSRGDFAAAINECPALPAKHSLTGYIRSWAITECFYPIFQLERVLPDHLHTEMEELFDRLRTAFAPGRRHTYHKLRAFFKKHQGRQKWLTDIHSGDFPIDAKTAQHVADWLTWRSPNTAQPEPAAILPYLDNFLSDSENRRELSDFVRSQVAITEALFAFRDSFQGPQAVVYDPERLLSSEIINRYDLFHLLAHYQLSQSLSKAQFLQEFGATDLEADYYFRLRGWRDPKLSLEFVYNSPDDQDLFESKWCRQVVGLSGLQLQARQVGGDILSGALPADITNALAAKPLVALILLPKDQGASAGRLRGTSIWSRRLTVRYPDGSNNDEYRIFTGKAAFEAHAELHGHFLLQDRLKPDVIIL